jgi:hypothetical protein
LVIVTTTLPPKIIFGLVRRLAGDGINENRIEALWRNYSFSP